MTTPPQSREQWLGNRIRRLIERDRDGNRERALPTGWSAPPTVRAADVDELTASWDIRFVVTASGRTRLGPLVTQIRRFLQAALFPLLVRISEFNAASVRVLAALAEHASELEGRNAALEERIERLERDTRVAVHAPFGNVDETRELRERIVDATLSAPGLIVAAGEVAEIVERLRDARREVLVADDDAASAVEEAGEGIGAVVLVGALEQLAPSNAARLLEIVADGLAPGGVLAVEAVNPRSARALLALSSADGLHPYDFDALEELLGSLGYVDVRLDLPTPHSARYSVVARRRPDV
jgi:hypothetical protein